MSVALELGGLESHVGARHVTRTVSLTLAAGARHALIVPNGAGKTTLVNLVTGALKPDAGRVVLGGRDITGLSQAERVQAGIARTFQINQLFRGLSALENVVLALAERDNEARNWWRPAGLNSALLDEGMAILKSLGIVGDAEKTIAGLPYGRQRLVEIAITLALKPKVLLLDEPAAGVPSVESDVILDVIAALPSDIAVLIIEHDMDVVFRFAKEITVLVDGGVLTSGPPEEIAANPEVKAVYLGEESHG
ncbi:MAG: ABC transporter ATP-binding protein [Rhodospirillales bacterium]